MAETHTEMEIEHKEWEKEHHQWKEKIADMRADHYKVLSIFKKIESEIMIHEANFVKVLQEIEAHSSEINDHRHDIEVHQCEEDKKLHKEMEDSHKAHSKEHAEYSKKIGEMQNCHEEIISKLKGLF